MGPPMILPMSFTRVFGRRLWQAVVPLSRILLHVVFVGGPLVAPLRVIVAGLRGGHISVVPVFPFANFVASRWDYRYGPSRDSADVVCVVIRATPVKGRRPFSAHFT